MDFAEPFFLNGPFEQLQGGVAAVLLDDEEAHAGIIAGPHHAHTILPARSHRLFRHDVHVVLCRNYRLLRMDAARGAERHKIDLLIPEHLG